ncbi:hypothetical protein KIPB_012912, partial [Kipferlia bialata]
YWRLQIGSCTSPCGASDTKPRTTYGIICM